MLRCKFKSRLLWLLYGVCIFVFLWTFTTLLIVITLQQDGAVRRADRNPELDLSHGVQVVVGHYNGKMPDKPKVNLSHEEINANRFDPIEGAGEMGRAVRLSASEDKRAQDLMSINQFNILVSDRIPLNRTLPDVRKPQCAERTYPADLPDTSVIIVFHNEAYSTLLRTVVSVVNRSPHGLVKEIVLVDDFSQREFLNAQLEAALEHIPTKIVLIRSQKRVGLIRARLMGAKEATGQVLTFLDSHCEATEGWLEPLLARIKEHPSIAVCPIIDVINDQTFAYQRGVELFRGAFNWNLQFRWYSVPPEEMHRRRQDLTLPIASPTMAGGLFSISKQYFEDIGRYDEQMNIWGGENLEMSFRIWQCGGRIEILPCSHVGHVFRKASPHDFPDNRTGSILNTNLARAAEVWMDKWKHLFYKTAPQAYDLAQEIDVSARLSLRRKLGCKDFAWYLSNVWKDHFLPMDSDFFGRVALSADDTCLASTPGEAGKRKHSLEMKKCTLGFDMWQFWILTRSGYLRSDEHQCLGASEVSGLWLVELRECAEIKTEIWSFDTSYNHLLHQESGLCLDRRTDSTGRGRVPTLRKCERRSSLTQVWQLRKVDWSQRRPFV